IRSFYADVRRDADLGYLFDEVAKIHWETQIPVIVDFWESIVLGTVEYKRNAMEPHFVLHRKSPLKHLHFEKWLQHFHHTIDSLFAGPNADLMKQRALSIAAVMEFKITETDSRNRM
ncbi:MAG: group III truncated hemoglobin, partial [Chitinophagales bacterium]